VRVAAVVDRFGHRAREYAAGRPHYPDALLADLPLTQGAIVVELGAGTGKFTRLLVRHGVRVIAVEPSEPMAERIPAEVGAPVEILIAAAESVPLPDGSADLVCVATAIHWFDYGPATAEMHRLIKPGGHLAIIFNRRDERVPWVAALSKMLDSHSHGAPRRSRGQWKAILSDPRFRLVNETSHDFAQQTTGQGIYDRVFSTSYVIALPPAEQDQVRAEVAAIIAAEPALRDAERLEFPYVSELHLLQRL
jgi:SAM-dependent methyltransferase